MVSSGSNSNISSPPPFRFITITERPASHKNDVSHTIRSHVMLSSLHQKRMGKSSKGLLRPVENSGTEAKTPKQLSGKFKLATWSRKSRRKVVPEGGLIDQIVGLKDEFGTSKNLKERGLEAPQYHEKVHPSSPLQAYGYSLPISITRSCIKKLLYHYSMDFRVNAFALNFDDAWKPFSVTDAALLHATLCLVAQHQDLLRGTNDSKENLWHKGEVMRLMNVRLRDVGRIVTDADITSVALLVILESINGTYEAASAHRVGLMKMLKFHGGYLSCKPVPVVLRVLAWSDIAFTTRFGGPLTFPMLFPNSSSFTRTLSPTIRLSQQPPYLLPVSMFSPQSSEILQALRSMTYAIDDPSLSLSDKNALVDLLYTTELRILVTEHYTPPIHSFEDKGVEYLSSTSTLEQAFILCSLMYLQLAIRELHPTSRIHERLLAQLLSLLQPITYYELIGPSDLDILLWCVFVGCATAKDRDIRTRLLMSIRGAELDIERVNLETIRERLRRVTWRARICDPILDVIWGQIQTRETGHVEEGGLNTEY